ncbi:MAG: outer membrane protein transport protein [Rhodospirillales bacterium]|nr:outer membrane protein transport protein [Rhodospirillales bacterium]
MRIVLRGSTGLPIGHAAALARDRRKGRFVGHSMAKITGPNAFAARYARRSSARWITAATAAMSASSAFSPSPSAASAFYVRDQSASSLANAHAGATADAEDLTYMFFNGAALAGVPSSGVAMLGTFTHAHARFDDGRASNALGSPIGGGNSDGGGNTLVPALYGAWKLDETFTQLADVVLGLAINAPFGFETEYDEDWIGRYHAVQSRLRTIDFNPVIAYRPIDGLSIAAGLQVEYVDAKLTSALDFGSLGAANGVPGAQPGAQDGFAKLTGDDWGYGWTAGLLFEPLPGTRLGLSYRSAVHQQLKGDTRVRLDDAGVGAALGVKPGTTAARAKLTLPEVIGIGLYQDLPHGWAVMADVTWTRWSRYRELRISVSDPAKPDDVTEEDWRDTWSFSAGATYRPSEDWALRTGIGYDQSPTRNKTRTPRTPSNNGLLIALGASYQAAPNIGFSVGYGHYFIESARIGLAADEPGNAARGNLSGSSHNGVDMLALQVNWSF